MLIRIRKDVTTLTKDLSKVPVKLTEISIRFFSHSSPPNPLYPLQSGIHLYNIPQTILEMSLLTSTLLNPVTNSQTSSHWIYKAAADTVVSPSWRPNSIFGFQDINLLFLFLLQWPHPLDLLCWLSSPNLLYN